MHDSLGLTGQELQFGRLRQCRSVRNEGGLDGDSAGTAIAVVDLSIDENLSTPITDVGVMYKDAATRYLVLLDGIGDGDLVLGNEPHVTVDAAMVGEVERHLLLAGRVGLVIAVVGLDSDDKLAGDRGVVAHTKGNGNGQVATLVLLYFLTVDVDGLLTHNGLKMEGDYTADTFLGKREVLAVPRYALVVAAAAGLGGHQLYGMWRADDFPPSIVEINPFSIGHIAKVEAPASVEVPYQPSAVL